MRRSNRLLAMLDTLQGLARNGWVFAACACLIAAAVSIQARVPRTTYRAIAMLQIAAGQSGELPSAAKIQDAIFHRAASDDRLAARVMTPKGKTEAGSPIEALRARLAVEDRAAAGLFAVEYVDENPQRAVDLANAFAALAIDEPKSDPIPVSWEDGAGEPITAETLKRSLDALQQHVDILRARVSVEADGFQSDLRTLTAVRRQLKTLRSALAAERSRPVETQSLESVALLRKLDGDLRELTTSTPANEEKIQTTQRQLEAELIGHVPGRATPEAPKDVAEPTDAKRLAKIASLEARIGSKRRAVAALTARVEAARDKQNEFAAAVVNLDAARLAYERTVAPSGFAAGEPRAVLVLPAVASTPTGRRPVWFPLVATGLIIAALILLVAASWQSYQARPVLSEAELRAVAPVPVLVSIPEIPYLVPPHARRWPFVTNAVFTALSLALLVVVLFQVIGR